MYVSLFKEWLMPLLSLAASEISCISLQALRLEPYNANTHKITHEDRSQYLPDSYAHNIAGSLPLTYKLETQVMTTSQSLQTAQQ